MKEKIYLVYMIDKTNDKDILLSSAIEKTEEITRTSVLDEQMKNVEKLAKEKDEKTKYNVYKNAYGRVNVSYAFSIFNI